MDINTIEKMYGKPLKLLEEAFCAAGKDIRFAIVQQANTEVRVDIYEAGTEEPRNSTYITADSAMAAIKDVAKIVKY
jgi:hypothetical protein